MKLLPKQLLGRLVDKVAEDKPALREKLQLIAEARDLDAFARCGPARTVTRVTHRRQLTAPQAAAAADFCQPATKYCHRN